MNCSHSLMVLLKATPTAENNRVFISFFFSPLPLGLLSLNH
jgi:hypothetical protein